MKKYIILTLVIIMMIFVFLGCSPAEEIINETPPAEKVQFLPCHIDYPHYKTVNELVDAVNYVAEGRITDISFKVMNAATGHVAKEPNEQGRLRLYTIYEVEIQKTYVGEQHEKIKFEVFGGIPGYKEQEQIAEMQKMGLIQQHAVIHTINDRLTFDTLNVGASYMFLLHDNGYDHMAIPNLYQSVFEIGTGDVTVTEPNYKSIVKFLEESNKDNK